MYQHNKKYRKEAICKLIKNLSYDFSTIIKPQNDPWWSSHNTIMKIKLCWQFQRNFYYLNACHQNIHKEIWLLESLALNNYRWHLHLSIFIVCLHSILMMSPNWPQSWSKFNLRIYSPSVTPNSLKDFWHKADAQMSSWIFYPFLYKASRWNRAIKEKFSKGFEVTMMKIRNISKLHRRCQIMEFENMQRYTSLKNLKFWNLFRLSRMNTFRKDCQVTISKNPFLFTPCMYWEIR